MSDKSRRRKGLLGLRLDDSITHQGITPGTVRRILPYARAYRWSLIALLTTTVTDAVITSASPLLLAVLIDDGISPRRLSVLVGLSIAIAGLAAVDALALFFQSWLSGRIGEGIICDLRRTLFDHLQRQSIAFFNRAQTGALLSRLNTDVVGAQDAVTTLLSRTVSTLLTLILILASMFFLSWQIALTSLLIIPVFLWPIKAIMRKVQRLTREKMQLDAAMGAMVTERFTISGAMLVKLYGRPEEESGSFGQRATRIRDIVIIRDVYGRLTFILTTTLLAAVTTALVYGLGGALVIDRTLQIGTLVAMVALLMRLYGPIGQLSNMQLTVSTALISFDRVFEILDLKPLVTERPGAHPLPFAPVGQIAPDIEFDRVSFRYPTDEVLVPTLESTVSRAAGHAPDQGETADVLREVSFRAPAGQLTALVGPSGAGKTTITHLVPRLFDPTKGAVRIGGHDIRDSTMRSLLDTVGVVPQDAHLFHDTIRANLTYARPDATEQELIEACVAAQIWDTISSLPDGLDTVVGDHGYRLSGGERQRVALARLLIKSPPIVVLDEATAHLDSESEVAIQQALKTALAGRTSIVIAHRLSTILDADQILVVDEGQILERGSHTELLALGGLYADLYRTQFARRPADKQNGNGANGANGAASQASAAVRTAGT